MQRFLSYCAAPRILIQLDFSYSFGVFVAGRRLIFVVFFFYLFFDILRLCSRPEGMWISACDTLSHMEVVQIVTNFIFKQMLYDLRTIVLLARAKHL